MSNIPPYAIARAVSGNNIRLTERQWTHIVEAHDYMAGNMDKVLETLEEPDSVIEGDAGESLALRLYLETNITRKALVVAFRNVADGFVITAFMTSRPDKVMRGRRKLWQRES